MRTLPTNDRHNHVLNFPSTRIWCEGFELLAHLSLFSVDTTAYIRACVYVCCVYYVRIQFNRGKLTSQKSILLFVPVPPHVRQTPKNLIIIFIKSRHITLAYAGLIGSLQCVVTSSCSIVDDIEIKKV